MPNVVKTPLEYIAQGDSVNEISESNIAQSIEANIDKLITASNAFDVVESGVNRYITTPFGIGVVIGTQTVAGASSTVNIDAFFNDILGIQVSQEGTVPGTTSFDVNDAQSFVLYRGSGSTTLHYVVWGTIDPLIAP